ncbi:MAG: hypothetical protein Q7S85_00580 [Rugosibacter sp.]|nr:hypothetical protein [Rugosibacter sp.]
MRDYARVSPQFWIGMTGKALRGDRDAQLVALYLMTSPHATMIGVFHCPVMYVAHETGLTIEGASKGLRRVVEDGFCSFDDDRELVWVHEMARFQIGAELKPNDNQVSAICRAFLQIPECQIRRGFHARYRDAFHLPDIENQAVETGGASKGVGSPLQAPPKPGTGEGTGEGTGAGIFQLSGDSCSAQPVADHLPACPHQEIIKLYAHHLPDLPQPRTWDGQRATNLKARWRWLLTAKKPKGGRYATNADDALAFFAKFFAHVAGSDFLTGRNGKWQGCNLPWLVKAENFAKVIEGQYDNREAA